ncbi:protein MpDIR44 [Marchantia polymorpha subsp. ruderalis]|nr:hypothetical protein MARPO_0121s0006 [Marchantia polymorpha]BBN06823.1 hypothetical protein Mp_3g24180 [Marchantia polymorpha subsp. ruderalis]|eukprot:PTQ30652.1 hypothetical protein MARPO_0121s0006 [Marchantia polymorpha]
MARATSIIGVLLGCVMLAAAVSASDSVNKYHFQFFQQPRESVLVFKPDSDQGTNGYTGRGYTFDYKTTLTYEPDSTPAGYVDGMVVYTGPNRGIETSTIFFKDIGEVGGMFANGEISLSGLWKDEESRQELAIVGGVGNFAGAYGKVVYTQVGPTLYLVQGEILIDAQGNDLQARKN